jgi:hypothetical protein
MSLPTIETKCDWCKNPYTKLRCEYRRSRKLGRPQFCSMKCSTEHRDDKLGKEGWKKIHSYLIKENSVFLQMLRTAKNKCQQRHKDIDIDVDYLEKLWSNQKGICPYTGIQMTLPESGKEYSKQYSLEKASLDRIDSSKGYVKGNVEFVCLAMNYAKNNRSQEEMKLFIEKVISNGTKIVQHTSR